jgi:hypothetical protein
MPREQVPEHLRSLWDEAQEARTTCGPLWLKSRDSTDDASAKEQEQLKWQLKEQNRIFQRILASKDPTERADLWRCLIKQMQYIGEGISKEVSKLYLCWFRTACLNRDATLEFDDESGDMGWNGIQLDVNQMKDWVVQRIIREPVEQRLNMVRKCSQFFVFSNEPQQRLRASIFSSGQLKMNQFVKLFRKALEFGVFNWTPMVEILHDAVTRWQVTQTKRLTKEYFNQEEFRTLWNRLSQFTDVESQLYGRLEARKTGIILPHGDEQTYCRWVKSLAEPKAYAKALILLQRTQEISKETWNMLKQEACATFGGREYREFLRNHDELMPKTHA